MINYKKLIIVSVVTAVLTGCGSVTVTRDYISKVPATKAKEFSTWVEDCKDNQLDAGMISSCYSLGFSIFSSQELNLNYTTSGPLGDYLWHKTVPCGTKTLTVEENGLCVGEVDIITYKR